VGIAPEGLTKTKEGKNKMAKKTLKKSKKIVATKNLRKDASQGF